MFPSRDETAAVVVDSHAHVFEQGLALAANRRYRPDYDARLPDYLAQLDQHGVTHGVLVQPSFLGTDNTYLIEALRQAPRRLRGVVVIEPGIEPVQLQQMHRAGVAGMRLNLVGLPVPDLASPGWQRLLEQVNALDWHVEVHIQAGRLQEVVPMLLAAGCRVVVDHFGRPDPALGTNDAGFRYLIEQADSGRVWVKLSAAYRIWPLAHCARAPRAAARLLLEAFGAQRLVWGSDWPHTQHPAVSYGPTRQWIADWIEDIPQVSAILTDTSLQLFHFEREVA
ncbi:amidohydrolase [Cupriavidus sp. AU9028]|uniref:amidohydrolase family protein n=1 Tax=Cupriavidus sp. AU9028 TaxID=2871157 RepID=UPI001C969591|nr:amidohydrolase family protein [Cupriavidus sp. AU9028]MBY4898567.1 amidohydrolase family protein [Cupriavidus sp. AU9028]